MSNNDLFGDLIATGRKARLPVAIAHIVEWAEERKFREGAVHTGQHVKGEEEMSEMILHCLEEGMGLGVIDADKITDDIGDQMVVAVIQCHMRGIDPNSVFYAVPECAEAEYRQVDLGWALLETAAYHGKLAAVVARNKPNNEFILAMQRYYEKLTVVATLLDIDINDAMFAAFAEISDRKGEWVNGVFVKEEDLNAS